MTFWRFFWIVWKFDFLKTFLSVLHFSARLEYFFFIIHHFHVVSTIVAPTSEKSAIRPPIEVSQNWLQWRTQASPQKYFFEIKILYKTCSFIKKGSTRSLRKSRFYHDSTLFVANSYVLKDQIPVIAITPLVLSSISTAWHRTRDRNRNPQYNL